MASYTQLGRVAEAIIVNLASGKRIVVRDLRIVFSIKKKAKKDDSTVNVATIKIYNMSPESRALVESVSDKNGDPQTAIELKVGYVEVATSLIFKGRCEVTSMYESPNWVTTFKGEDGKAQFKYNFEKKYSKGTPISKIVQDIAEKSGMYKFSLVTLPDKLKKARTFSGPPLKIIKTLQKTYGFLFDIQDEGTIIRSNKYKADRRYTIKMDYGKGLLGEPRTKGNLVIIDTLINPEIRPNSYIELRSNARSNLNGTYSIQGVSTSGDSYSGPWNMEVEMIYSKSPESVPTTTDVSRSYSSYA